MQSFPESPEGVALFLLCLLLNRDATERSTLLALFADCLAAANGEEEVGPVLH